MEFKTRVKQPNLKLEDPGRKFFKSAAIETKRRIRRRTERQKVDFEGKRFRAYTPDYADYRAETGRSTTPNLSFSGRMLGSMKGSATSRKGMVTLSGDEADKAIRLEAGGRKFFAFSDNDRDQVNEMLADWMQKKNNLKR